MPGLPKKARATNDTIKRLANLLRITFVISNFSLSFLDLRSAVLLNCVLHLGLFIAFSIKGNGRFVLTVR